MTLQRFPEWPFPDKLDSFEKVQEFSELMYVALVEDSLQRTEDLNTTDINTIGDITLTQGNLTLDAGDIALTLGDLTAVNITATTLLTTLNLAVTNTTIFNSLTLDGGTYNITLDAGTPTMNVTLVFPADDGDANQVLTTNGSGALTWETPAAGGTNISLLTTTASVDCSSAATTTIYTVPSGKSCIVTHVIVRNPSADSQTVWFEVGFDVQDGVISIAEDSWSTETMIPPNTSEAVIVLSGGSGRMPAGTPAGGDPYNARIEIGDASDTLVFKCINGQASLTATVDVFGYTY